MALAHPTRGYWLEGQMVDCELDVIEEVFTWSPPTNLELSRLLLEESRGRNRPGFFAMCVKWKREP